METIIYKGLQNGVRSDCHIVDFHCQIVPPLPLLINLQVSCTCSVKIIQVQCLAWSIMQMHGHINITTVTVNYHVKY